MKSTEFWGLITAQVKKNKKKQKKKWKVAILCPTSSRNNKLDVEHLTWSKLSTRRSLRHGPHLVTPRAECPWPPPASSGSRPTGWTAWTAGTSANQRTGFSGKTTLLCVVTRNNLVKLKGAPFCCIPQRASSLPGTEPQFGPEGDTEESAGTETRDDRRRRGMRRGAHLLFDMNLRQALQLGAVFRYVCGQHRHTADKRPDGAHTQARKPSRSPLSAPWHLQFTAWPRSAVTKSKVCGAGQTEQTSLKKKSQFNLKSVKLSSEWMTGSWQKQLLAWKVRV